LGYKPKYVYLHRGTREGARAMQKDVNRTYIPKKEFPEFQKLETYDIENILCIYKNHLERIYKAKF
jgi:hypothetical protein